MEGFGAIPVFVAAVEHGGFSPAARALGISKAAVSKRIGQLEQKLGVRLLHRTTRKLSLTEAGEHYFRYAAQALQAAKQAEDAVTQLQGAAQGQLRINVPMSFGRLHLVPLIPQLMQRHPGLEINLVMDDRTVNLVQEGFDLAIRIGALRDSSLVARKLAPSRYVLCAAPAYLARHGQPATPAELSAHNCLLYSYLSEGNEWVLVGEGALERVKVSGNYQVNNGEALLDAACAGVGIARSPTFIAGAALAEGRLVPLLTQWQVAEQAIYAVFPERKYLPAKVRVFLDFVTERLGGDEPYWDQWRRGSK